MKKNFVVILVLLFLMILISGCINILPTPGEDLLEPEDDSITPGKGRLKIYLTDAPGDYLEVNITISRIEAHIAGEDDGAEGYWVVLKDWLYEIESGLIDELPVFDLIELKDKSILLSEEELALGKYTQIRIFITESYILVEKEGETESEDIKAIEVANEVDFETFDVEIPSVYQTGIKLIHPFEIIEGEITELTIDFDAEESIIKTGDGSYKLRPTIKVITNISE